MRFNPRPLRTVRIVEGQEKCPYATAETIKKAVGPDKQAIDAAITVDLLQALQPAFDGRFRNGDVRKASEVTNFT
jgi:hypothetical protein